MASVNSGLIWRSGLAAALLLAAAPLAAQDIGNSTAGTTTPAPPPTDNIGPRELSNFSINGTVTRPAEAQPPATATREPQLAAPATTEPPEPARTAAAEPARERQAERQPTPDPLSQPPTLSGPSTPVRTGASAAPAFAGVADTPSIPIEPDYGFSPLPWIAALLLLGAGAVIYFGRQRRGQRYAGVGHAPLREYVPEPQPSPQPGPRLQPERKPPSTLLRQPPPSGGVTTAPRPDPQPAPSGGVTTRLRPAVQPAPGPAVPAGLVSTSLRPWIDLELTPIQANLTDEHAAILFEVALFNSGSAPARDVAVEACLINVGQDQEKLLGDFFANRATSRDTIPLIAPFARVPLRSVVRLPRAAVREYQVQGRKLFMPMVGINARYRWSSGEGQSATGFLVGKDQGDPTAKLAPLRVDQGARGWKKLGVRPYERGIRR